jgi:hypothetical protein
MTLRLVGGTDVPAREHLTPEDLRVLDWLAELDRLGPDAAVDGCWVVPEFVQVGAMLKCRYSCQTHGSFGGWAIAPIGSDTLALMVAAETLGPKDCRGSRGSPSSA